ncbi:MAG TPA: NAD(P)-dependent oxidoreductase [Acidimicrobiales bacterium]|nr:NAD(P)-dependent oxidoreductase [Acidimicrobiales bacterium]
MTPAAPPPPDSDAGPVVGVVGLGNMGGGIARSLVRAGFDVLVFDTRPEAVQSLADAGARPAGSLAALASEASVISVVVVNDRQVDDVVATVEEHARPDTVVVVHSTVLPTTVIDLAHRAAEHQVVVIDAAVSGGSEKSELGSLSIMIGGDEPTVKRCWPVFEAMGSELFHVGPVGSGVTVKLVNNLLSIGGYALQLEAMQLAAAYGIDEDMVTRVVTASQGDSRGMRTWGRHDRIRRERQAMDHVDITQFMTKDLHEATIAAGLAEVTLPLTAVAADILPAKMARRDRELAARPERPPIPRCDGCGQELALPFRDMGRHPECRIG